MIKVLVVDDSSFMRASLTHMLQADQEIKVIGSAADGEDAIRKVKQLLPDVVLMDIEMPKMDGLTALAHIMANSPTPVVILSGLSEQDATLAMKSLGHGAVDFIVKPSGTISFDIEKISQDIISKVKIAVRAKVHPMALRLPEFSYKRDLPKKETRKKIIVIGASTGGPRAVVKVLSELPRDLSPSVMVIQHLYPEFMPSFVEWLQWGTALRVFIARKGEVIQPGSVLVALGGCHTVILKDGNAGRIQLSLKGNSPDILPSVDRTMESAARAYGESTLGVLLTGVGSDGAKGMKAIKDVGGSTIAEDESTCVVFGMPKAAIELGCVDKVVPLPRIAETILRMI